MVPNGWELRELKDLTAIYDGTHSTPKYVEYGVPFYSVEHLTKGDFSKTKFISEEVFDKENKRVKLERDDILMTRIGDIGTAVHLDWNVRASFYVSLALLKASSHFDSSFMTQYINSSEFHRELWKRIIHVAFPKKINLGEIGKCHVLLPPMPEQRKIAKILSTWDKAISTTERLIDNSKQQKKALIQQLLTGKKRLLDDSGKQFEGEWEEVKLGEISHITTGSSNREDSSLDGEYTFFDRSEDIRTSSRYLFDSEAVIVPGEGQDFVPKHFEGKFDLHQRTYAIMNFDGCVGRFLFYYIRYHRHYFLAQAVGSTVKSLRLPMFQKMPINLPNQLEQAKIASVLNNADREIKILQQQLADLKQEKKALMQQLLTGKRRVKIDEKEVA